MGILKDRIVEARNNNKQDRNTNPTGNDDFKVELLSIIPEKFHPVLDGLHRLQDGVTVYNLSVLRILFGMSKAMSFDTINKEFKKIWEQTKPDAKAFLDAVYNLNHESAELLSVTDSFKKNIEAGEETLDLKTFAKRLVAYVEDLNLLEDMLTLTPNVELSYESKYNYILNVLAGSDQFDKTKETLYSALTTLDCVVELEEGDKEKAAQVIDAKFDEVKDQEIGFPVPYWELDKLDVDFAFLPDSVLAEIATAEDEPEGSVALDNLRYCVADADSLKGDDKASDEERFEALDKLRSYHAKYAEIIAEEIIKADAAAEAEKAENAPTPEEIARKAGLLSNLEVYKNGLFTRLLEEGKPQERVSKALNSLYTTLKEEIESGAITTDATFNDRSNALFKTSKTLTIREASVAKAEGEAKRLAEIESKVVNEKKSHIPTILEKVEKAFEAAPESAKEVTLYGVTVPEVLAISAYPYNRDTEHRMKKEHLQGKITSRGQERIVAILLDEELNKDLIDTLIKQYSLTPELRSGFLMLVDGHGRCHAWSKPGSFGGWHLERPEALSLAVMRGLTNDEIKHEVEIHGGKLQAITTEEAAQMANKENKLDLKSDFSRKSWKSAFKAVGIKEESEGRKQYGKVLEAVDAFNLKNTYAGANASKKAYVVVGVKAGILACWDYLVKQGDENVEPLVSFWKNFFQSTGLIAKSEGFTESKHSSELITLIDETVKNKQTRNSTYDGELKATALTGFKSFYEAHNKPKQDDAA